MKNVNWFLKILSVTLVFALCFTMFASVPVSAVNIQVQADDSLLPGDLTPEELKTAELDTEDIPEILRDEEIEEKDHVNRLYEQEDSLNSVMFQNRDGTKTKYLYNAPVKYVDDKGEIQDKSNVIYTTLFGNFETRENDITSYFPKKINQNKGVEISFKEYTVEMSPDIKGNSGASRQTGHNKYGDPTDYVQYPDVFDEGISVRYTPTFDGLKEDIILEEYTGINEFTFVLRTDGLKLFLDENGIPKLSDPETNEVLLDLGALYIYDSGEPELFGDWDHKYILKTVEENKEYKITVSVDKDYLADPERVYPVHVDPSATLDPDGLGMYKTIMDAPIYDGVPNAQCGSNIYGVVGYHPTYGTGKLLMKFPGLLYDSTYSNLIEEQITALDLHFFEGSNTTTSVELDAYHYFGSDWNESSITYNTAFLEHYGNYISTAEVSTSGWYSLTLFPAVDDWMSATDAIYKGIIIKNYTGEYHQAFAKDICTTEHPQIDLDGDGYAETECNPYLSYTYLPYIPVNGIDITHTELSIAVGETATIFATVTPTNATNQNVIFTSNNTSVATVDPDSGYVTGVSAGVTTVTATSEDGGFAAHCTVNVIGPTVFATLERQGLLGFGDIAFTDDDFHITTKSLSDILNAAGISSLLDSSNDSISCSGYFDDWYIFAVPSSSGYTYGLYKMREQESDSDDYNDPGVTISFIKFNTTLLLNCISSNTASNKKSLYSHLNNVVAENDRERVTHNTDIYNYFRLSEKEGAYLIIDKYIKFIGSCASNGYIYVPNNYTAVYNDDTDSRVPNGVDANNSDAGYTVCDHNKVYIADANNLSVYEKYAIMMTHTANVNFNSFAAEVVFHARALTDSLSVFDDYYMRAIRADMAIGEEYEIAGIGVFDDYYDLDSSLVQEQVERHGEK